MAIKRMAIKRMARFVEHHLNQQKEIIFDNLN